MPRHFWRFPHTRSVVDFRPGHHLFSLMLSNCKALLFSFLLFPLFYETFPVLALMSFPVCCLLLFRGLGYTGTFKEQRSVLGGEHGA